MDPMDGHGSLFGSCLDAPAPVARGKMPSRLVCVCPVWCAKRHRIQKCASLPLCPSQLWGKQVGLIVAAHVTSKFVLTWDWGCLIAV